MMMMKSMVRDLCMHCIPVTEEKRLIYTSFRTVLTKQSMVPLNKSSSPGFDSGAV